MKILKAYIFGYDEGVTNKKNLGISKVEKRKVKGKRSVIVIFCIIVLYYEIDNWLIWLNTACPLIFVGAYRADC